jgi:beta-xylosidase
MLITRRAAGLMLVIPGLTLLVACSQTPAGREPVAASSVPSASSSAPSDSATGFRNPVYDGNFPDPMVVDGGNGTYWAFATNGSGSNVQTLTSKNLINWESGSDALPYLPDWSNPGKVWAPEVARNKVGYVLYYTTSVTSSHVQCVGVGVAAKLAGPYIDNSRKPLVCQPDQGGSIDAHAFTASHGKRYLYWKNDGNAMGSDTYISVQQLDDTGAALVGKPKRLFKQDLPWEGRLVEAPFVWEENGKFHLFYSANAFDSYSYAIGHAVADTPLGPFTKSQEPVVASNDVAAGPGHCALVRKGGKVWMLYHAWPPEAIGSESPGRNMWLSEVTFSPDGSVTVVAPTVDYPTRP